VGSRKEESRGWGNRVRRSRSWVVKWEAVSSKKGQKKAVELGAGRGYFLHWGRGIVGGKWLVIVGEVGWGAS